MTPAEEDDDSYQAPALKKGLEVLEFLSGQSEPYALSDLARALGKSRNEIYRMVIVLERLGYLARTDADRFSITRKLFDLAMQTPPERNLLLKALPEMERLAAETFQSCHLTVASRTDIVVVARVERLVALKHARTGKAAKDPVGGLVHVGHEAFDVEERNGLIGFDEIANKETRPGIAGAGIGREKNVVVKNGDFTLQQRATEQCIANLR